MIYEPQNACLQQASEIVYMYNTSIVFRVLVESI